MNTSRRKTYINTVKKHWFVYFLGCLGIFFTVCDEIFQPKFMQWIIDGLSTNNANKVPDLFFRLDKKEMLKILTLYLALLIFIGYLGRVLWRQTLARMTHVVGFRYKIRFWDVLRYLPLKRYNEFTLGDFLNRATSDWNSIRSIHGFTLIETFDIFFLTIIIFIAMFSIDVELSIYCFLSFVLAIPFIRHFSKKQNKEHTIAQESLSKLSELISQTLSTLKLQRATGSEYIWQKKLKISANKYAVNRYARVKSQWNVFPFGVTPTLIAYALILYFGINKIMLKELTPGEFVALQSYVLLLQMPLFELSSCISEWQSGLASLTRVLEIHKLKDDKDSSKKINLITVSTDKIPLQITNLSFSYPGDHRNLLQNIDLSINPGEQVGLTGEVGSAKSTIQNIIAGVLPYSKGSIKLWGLECNTIKRTSLVKHLGVVQQKPFLFTGSLRYNLELDQSYTDKQLWEILETVSLKEYVEGLNEGIDTWIGEWGINLSGGQKQRLALARTLIRPKPENYLLLLDDCLSAVDSITEDKILANIEEKLSNISVLWIAHRQSTLRHCIRIFRLENKKLTQLK